MLNKFRLYTFAICAIACAAVWIMTFVTALLSIGKLGFIAFIVLLLIITIILGFPLLFLANMLGISKLASK